MPYHTYADTTHIRHTHSQNRPFIITQHTYSAALDLHAHIYHKPPHTHTYIHTHTKQYLTAIQKNPYNSSFVTIPMNIVKSLVSLNWLFQMVSNYSSHN